MIYAMTMIDLKYKYSKFVYKLCQTICHYVVRHLRLLHLPLKACGSWASFFLVEVVLNEQKALCGVAGHQNLTLVFNKNRLDLVEVTGRFDLSD